MQTFPHDPGPGKFTGKTGPTPAGQRIYWKNLYLLQSGLKRCLGFGKENYDLIFNLKVSRKRDK